MYLEHTQDRDCSGFQPSQAPVQSETHSVTVASNDAPALIESAPGAVGEIPGRSRGLETMTLRPHVALAAKSTTFIATVGPLASKARH